MSFLYEQSEVGGKPKRLPRAPHSSHTPFSWKLVWDANKHDPTFNEKLNKRIKAIRKTSDNRSRAKGFDEKRFWQDELEALARHFCK